MQSIFKSISSFVSGQFNDAQAAQGSTDLAASLEVTKADVLQAEEAERERRIKSYEFKECALANAKLASNIIRAAGFPQPVLQQGAKKRTRIIEELERTRRSQNQEESDARRHTSKTTSDLITSLGWPFIRTEVVGDEPSVTKREIDESFNRLAMLVSQQRALSDVNPSEEEDPVRREIDAQGRLQATIIAPPTSEDVEVHTADAVTSEEQERDRRRNSLSEAAARSNANAVASLVHNYRQETLAQTEKLFADQERLRKAGAKLVSDMILDARRIFESSQNNKPSGNDTLAQSLDAPRQTLPADLQLVRNVSDPVYNIPSTYAVAPQNVVTGSILSVGPSEVLIASTVLDTAPVPLPANPTPVVTAVDSARLPKSAVTFSEPTFARTYSIAGSLSPTIFPLRRSILTSSSDMRPVEESSTSTPKYKVVIVPDPTPLGSNRTSFNVPELSRSTSGGTLVDAPQAFVAHPLSRSLSAHELSYLKKEATKHEKISAKQTKQAEKLMNKSEKLKAKGKLEKAKKKQVKAFELRQEALKHEESANKSKFGTTLTPAPPTM